jgi:hypothetical protein
MGSVSDRDWQLIIQEKPGNNLIRMLPQIPDLCVPILANPPTLGPSSPCLPQKLFDSLCFMLRFMKKGTIMMFKGLGFEDPFSQPWCYCPLNQRPLVSRYVNMRSTCPLTIARGGLHVTQ